MGETWNHAFDTGIAFIDERHRGRYELVVRFSASDATEGEMRGLLDELRSRTL